MRHMIAREKGEEGIRLLSILIETGLFGGKCLSSCDGMAKI